MNESQKRENQAYSYFSTYKTHPFPYLLNQFISLTFLSSHMTRTPGDAK